MPTGAIPPAEVIPNITDGIVFNALGPDVPKPAVAATQTAAAPLLPSTSSGCIPAVP